MKLSSEQRYEIRAETFRIMTGHMAPGKDPPMLSYPSPFEERYQRYEKWSEEFYVVVDAVLLAVERIMEDTPDGD